jgi:transposase InsO family protein
MTTLQQRQTVLTLINEACQSGARRHKACRQIGLTVRTLQRWQQVSRQAGDRRTRALRRAPDTTHNQLSPEERAQVLEVVNSAPFKNLPPSQIVPRLADEGRYLASESTLYRILRQENQMTHRRCEKPAQPRARPRSLCAQAINTIFTWDITYLPTQVRGQFYYLYAFVDLFSRKIVGWQVFETESAEQASALLKNICERHGIKPDQLILHSDNGAPMKGQTMMAMMQTLGVSYSRSRPSVSNDNPYSESLFRTLKYRADLPIEPFADLSQARDCIAALVHWYNEEHHHSGIQFVTPSQRHAGLDQDILLARKQVYEQAKAEKSQRWSKETRNWGYINEVHLNPQKPVEKKGAKTSHL